MLAMPCHAANCRTILRHRVLLLFILVTATAFTTFPTLSDKTRNIQYMCHFVLFYILCWWLNDKYMGVYLIYGSPNFWKPHCVCIQVNSPSAALMLSIPRCQRTIEVLKERPAFEIFCIRNENILQWRWKISYWLQPATLIEPIFRGADFHNRISEKNSESTKVLKSNDNSFF